MIDNFDYLPEKKKYFKGYTETTTFKLTLDQCKALKLEMFLGEDAIFIFQWEFKQWDDSDMENQKIEDLLNDDLIYVLNDNAIKQIGL